MDVIEVDNASELRRSTAVVYHSDRRALSTVRLRRAGQLATADTCSARVISFRAILYGATENARHENTGRSKMQDLKMRDMNLRHHIAGVENARHENAGPICMGGKCGKS